MRRSPVLPAAADLRATAPTAAVLPIILLLGALVLGTLLVAGPSVAGEPTPSPTDGVTPVDTSDPTPTGETVGPTEETAPTESATDTSSDTPTTSESPEVTSSEEGESVAPTTESPSASADATDTPDEAEDDAGDDESTTPTQTVPTPPTITTREVPVLSWSIALGVLLAAALALLVLRLPPDAPPPLPGAPAGTVSSAEESFAAIEAVGAAMLDAGYSVGTVEEALRDIALANGLSAQILVFPNSLIVSARGKDELRTGAMAGGLSPLLLHQIDELDRLVARGRTGAVHAAQLRAAIADLRALDPPYSKGQRLVAYSFVCGALAVLLGASWLGVAVAGALGLAVGAVLLLRAERARTYRPLSTVVLALLVSTTVILLSRGGWDPGVLPSMIAPLVILLPGALLTTGVLELASGQLMSGAGRLAAGAMQLVLLGIGIVAGARLVGVPSIELEGAGESLGAVAPWLAVAVFGIGIMVYRCGRARSIPWVLLVLYVAYGAQVVGSLFVGGVLSALVGALVMTPVAHLVARRDTGPSPLVSFLPAFWLLVPGALGLVGVASLLAGDAAGMDTLVTTTATMVGIALGILAGSAVSSRVSPV